MGMSGICGSWSISFRCSCDRLPGIGQCTAPQVLLQSLHPANISDWLAELYVVVLFQHNPSNESECHSLAHDKLDTASSKCDILKYSNHDTKPSMRQNNVISANVIKHICGYFFFFFFCIKEHHLYMNQKPRKHMTSYSGISFWTSFDMHVAL